MSVFLLNARLSEKSKGKFGRGWNQGVKKRWLTNRALVYDPKCEGGGEGLRDLSQWVQLYTGAQISSGDLTPFQTYGWNIQWVMQKPLIKRCFFIWRFLFTVVTKLSCRGYQPHLQDLLLRLNFNQFYDDSSFNLTSWRPAPPPGPPSSQLQPVLRRQLVQPHQLTASPTSRTCSFASTSTSSTTIARSTSPADGQIDLQKLWYLDLKYYRYSFRRKKASYWNYIPSFIVASLFSL